MAHRSTALDSEAILANAIALGPGIEAAADRIAEARRLPDDLIEDLRCAGVFRVLLNLSGVYE